MVSPQFCFPVTCGSGPADPRCMKHLISEEVGWNLPKNKTVQAIHKEISGQFEKRRSLHPNIVCFFLTKRSRSELTNQQHHKRFISGANGTPICQDRWEVRTCQRWVVPTVGFRVLFLHTNLPTLPAASLRLTSQGNPVGSVYHRKPKSAFSRVPHFKCTFLSVFITTRDNATKKHQDNSCNFSSFTTSRLRLWSFGTTLSAKERIR